MRKASNDTAANIGARDAAVATGTATGPPRTRRVTPRRLVNGVRGRVAGELNARKNRVTETLDGVAETIRQVGEPLHKLPYPALGDYAERAAARIEQAARDLRERDVEQLAREMGELARQRPAVFVGAGLAAGLLAGRFLRSGPPSRRRASRRVQRGAPMSKL